jgi:hypothetical protein
MSALPPKADIRCFIKKMVDQLLLSWRHTMLTLRRGWNGDMAYQCCQCY